MHVFGTGVLRRLGVARSASSPKSSAGLRMQPYPRSPDLVWPGHLHGTGCLSARAMDTGFPTVVWCLCLGSGCVWGRVSAAPGHSLLWCWGVCVCSCARSACTPPLLAGVCCVGVCAWARVSAAPRRSWLGCWVCVCVRVPTPLVPSNSWLGCAAWVCVLGLRCRLRPATLDWGVGVCVCSCARAVCTPPLLAGVCGVGVCLGSGFGCAHHSWLGCWGVCVFVCPLRHS